MDENEYLQPDFDPASYKVAQLRNVLLHNDVSYPSSAKKKDLIELFNQHIKPNAQRKLKELQSVIANDEGIVYIEKKSKQSKVISDDEVESSDLKVENSRSKSSKKVNEEKSPRKSPRKTSQSTKVEDDDDDVLEIPEPSPRKSRVPARNVSNELGKIPDLKKSPPRARERSPRRKTSSKADEDEKIEDVKPRERSPRRKASEKKEAKSLIRERSPSRKAKESEDVKPKKKDSKKSSKVKEELKPEPKAVEKDNSDGDDDLQQVTEEEFRNTKSPFKFGFKSKFESSFSNDNVFQSPGHSSPVDTKAKKTIPRKRNSENPSSKSAKKSKVRKTAFSSSPEPHQPVKSPAKKALEISKFEASSPPSNFLKNEIENNDIFAVEEVHKETYKLDDITKKTPATVEKPKQAAFEKENFETPNDGNASKISNFSSAASTPSKSAVKRKSLLPDFSKFKVSRDFARTLGITIQGEPEEQNAETNEEGKAEDPELLDEESEEEENETSDNEAEESVNDDSVLRNLQEEIDSAKLAVEKEAADAIKQVNDVFTEEKSEEEEQEEVEKSAEVKKSSFNFCAVFTFLKQLFVFFLFVFTVIFALWYREQRILIGYCGSEIDQPTFPNAQNEHLVKFDDFLQTLKPTCLDAPENAITLPKMKIKCRPGFAVYEPWYKVHGFFPFSDYCVKDEEKENIIKEVVSKSLELLRTKNANNKCGDGDDLDVGISDEELYNFFFESKSPSISDEKFDDVWSTVLEDLKKEPELTLRRIRVYDTESSEGDLSSDEDEEETYLPKEQTIFRSNSKVKLSIECKFRKEIYENYARNKKLFIGTFLTLFILLFSYKTFTSYQQRQSKIKEISEIILIKLQKQQKNAINDSTGLTNRYISNIQLRDELLSNLKNSEKYEIWESILNKLEKNSSVRGSTREIHGDIVKVYEWIGE